MTASAGRIRSVLVPVDFSAPSRAAMARARWIAERCDASLHLLHAVRSPVVAMPHEVAIPQATQAEIRKAAADRIEALRAELEGGGRSVTADLADGDPVAAIGTAAGKHGADLVVMGTHGYSGVRHIFLGSVAERTLRTLPVPVLCVKEDEAAAAEPIARILVAVDFSAGSRCAADLALELAGAFGADVDVLHVLDVPADVLPYAVPIPDKLIERMRDDAARKLELCVDDLADRGVTVTSHLRRGHAATVIGAEAERVGADLIALGTRGNTGLEHVFLGSVAERTLRLAPCSVLTARDGK